MCKPPSPNGSPRGLGHRLNRLALRSACRLGGGLSHLLGSRAGGALGVLMYHRVTPWDRASSAPTFNVAPERFRAQLEGLLGRNYRALPLRLALELGQAGQPFPPKSFVVTFDDGYENVYRHAWPILRALKVPATVFLATAYLDQDGPFPFDDWPSAGLGSVSPESWRPLTTAQCSEMLQSGLVDLGSHTHHHALFQGRANELRADVLASLAVLRERFGLERATFAFPFGFTEPALVDAVRGSGALCALTTEGALVRPRADPFSWGRFLVEDADSVWTVAGKLDGWYSLARSAWRRLARPNSEATT